MKKKLSLLLFVPFYFLGCSNNYANIDDLLYTSYSHIDLQKPNCRLTTYTLDENGLWRGLRIYGTNIDDTSRREYKYVAGNEKYILYCGPTSFGEKEIVPDKELSAQLDSLFKSAVYKKVDIDKKTFNNYLSFFNIIYGNKSYYVDGQGHLSYLEDDSYYRSDLKVDFLLFVKHLFYYIEMPKNLRDIVLMHDNKYTYKGISYSYDDLKDYLPDDNRDGNFIPVKPISGHYTFYDTLPTVDDGLYVGDSCIITKNNTMYILEDHLSFLANYSTQINLVFDEFPYVYSANVGNIFDDIFEYIESN